MDSGRAAQDSWAPRGAPAWDSRHSHSPAAPACREGCPPVPPLPAALGSLTEVRQEETLVSDGKTSARFYNSVSQRLGRRLREDRLVDPVGDSHGRGEHEATG